MCKICIFCLGCTSKANLGSTSKANHACTQLSDLYRIVLYRALTGADFLRA